MNSHVHIMFTILEKPHMYSRFYEGSHLKIKKKIKKSEHVRHLHLIYKYDISIHDINNAKLQPCRDTKRKVKFYTLRKEGNILLRIENNDKK